LLVASFFVFASPIHAQTSTSTIVLPDGSSVTPQQDVFFLGRVVGTPDEHFESDFGANTLVQDVSVLIEEGPDKGKRITAEFSLPEGTSGRARLRANQRVIVGYGGMIDDRQYYISDVYRLPALWGILIVFFVLTVVFARSYGVRAFFGLGLSLAVIVWFIAPQILAGRNPFLVSFLGTILIACTSLYVAHGFHKRTNIAFVSTLTTIGLSLWIASVSVRATHLFGLGSEDAFFLQNAGVGPINLQGILLGGIVIGVLGILDDITTAQAAVVEQIHQADPTLGFVELYRRGSSVGREHIISLVNTLVLAYTGASLPLLLLFLLYERPTWIVLNSEIVMEELIRMLVGSICLVLAVPITTAIAAKYYSTKHYKTLLF